MSTRNDATRDTFLQICDSWIRDGYSFDLRYLAHRDADGLTIVHASLFLNPLPKTMDLALELPFGDWQVGQVQGDHRSRTELIEFAASACGGTIVLDGDVLTLPYTGEPYFQTPGGIGTSWFSAAELTLLGAQLEPPSFDELSRLDDALRSSPTPFDGCEDLLGWLGLGFPPQGGGPARLRVRVGPPVDLILGESHLTSGRLELTLHAHESFDPGSLMLGIRAVPEVGLMSRQQIADQFSWSGPVDGRLVGRAAIEVGNANSCFTMLVVGGRTVRRQWFVDTLRTPNRRLLAVSTFDADLKMVRDGLFESSDSRRFEHAVAALLFLNGFSPSVQLETDAPDIIFTSPGGRLILVECTLRIADIAGKVGKLVDRRGALRSVLLEQEALPEVATFLVCRASRDQIALDQDLLRRHDVVLITQEDLREGLVRLHASPNPDELLLSLVGEPRFDI